MNTVTTRLDRIEVSNVSPSDGYVELAVHVNNLSIQRSSSFPWKSVILDPKTEAEMIVSKAREMEKRGSVSFGKDPVFSDFVLVKVENEHYSVKKITGFLRKLKTKVDNVRNFNTPGDFVSQVNSIKDMKLGL